MKITFRLSVRAPLFWHLTISKTRRFHSHRCQLYGEDNLSTADDDNVLHLGSWRAARIRQHVTACVQRRDSAALHVRSDPKIDAEFGKGVVQAGKGFQQG